MSSRAVGKQTRRLQCAFAEYVRSVIPDFSAIENEDRGKHGKQLIVSFKNSLPQERLTVEFDALSDGEKCYFLGAYLIALNSVAFLTVCVWDEPDNHLSISEIGHFITMLRQSAKRGGQFIALSHHPETVRKFSDDTTIVLTRRSHLDPTVAKYLSDFGDSGDLTPIIHECWKQNGLYSV